MSGSTGAERRRHSRHSLVLRVEYRGQQDYLGDWTENVSAGGLFVRTDLPLSVGETVGLDLSFPGLLDSVSVSGTVAWVRPEDETEPRGLGIRVEDDVCRRRLAELALRASFAGGTGVAARVFRVLLVEDNVHVTHMYRSVLRRIQAVARTAVDVAFTENGHAAVLLLEQGELFDLIITDVYMPVMDGLQLLRYVRQSSGKPTTPVVVVTCGTSDESTLARHAGADAFLHKPVQFGQLLETIACLLHP